MPQRDLELNLTPLYDLMNKNASQNKIALKEALSNPRFAQVGINLFRDQVDNCIWTIQKGDNGADYIVRSEAESNLWSAHADIAAETLVLSFCGAPIYKFASQEFGFTKESIMEFKKYIMAKVQDPVFIKSLYALVAHKCPICGQTPKSIGLTKIECSCK